MQTNQTNIIIQNYNQIVTKYNAGITTLKPDQIHKEYNYMKKLYDSSNSMTLSMPYPPKDYPYHKYGNALSSEDYD